MQLWSDDVLTFTPYFGLVAHTRHNGVKEQDAIYLHSHIFATFSFTARSHHSRYVHILLLEKKYITTTEWGNPESTKTHSCALLPGLLLCFVSPLPLHLLPPICTLLGVFLVVTRGVFRCLGNWHIFFRSKRERYIGWQSGHACCQIVIAMKRFTRKEEIRLWEVYSA